jgi:hypothetical protein
MSWLCAFREKPRRPWEGVGTICSRCPIAVEQPCLVGKSASIAAPWPLWSDPRGDRLGDRCSQPSPPAVLESATGTAWLAHRMVIGCRSRVVFDGLRG